jgi:hypothetical protein
MKLATSTALRTHIESTLRRAQRRHLGAKRERGYYGRI